MAELYRVLKRKEGTRKKDITIYKLAHKLKLDLDMCKVDRLHFNHKRY